MLKQYLMTAGPTPVPERVALAMAQPILYHRAPVFTEVLNEALAGLKWIFQTAQPVLILAGATRCASSTRSARWARSTCRWTSGASTCSLPARRRR